MTGLVQLVGFSLSCPSDSKTVQIMEKKNTEKQFIKHSFPPHAFSQDSTHTHTPLRSHNTLPQAETAISNTPRRPKLPLANRSLVFNIYRLVLFLFRFGLLHDCMIMHSVISLNSVPPWIIDELRLFASFTFTCADGKSKKTKRERSRNILLVRLRLCCSVIRSLSPNHFLV